MKVVLVNAPFSFTSIKQFALPPLGILYLGSYLEQQRPGIEVEYLDLETKDWSLERCIDELIARSPDVIGFSSMTPFIRNTMKLVSGVKQRAPGIKTIVGGPHVSATGDEIYSVDLPHYPDYLVMGEGEETLLEIIDHLHDDEREIEGCVRRNSQGRTIGKPVKRQFRQDLDELPLLDFSKLDLSAYTAVQTKASHTVSLMGGRGCPFTCAYCDVFATQGRKLRVRSAKHVADEIELNLRKNGITDYYFKDSIFTLNRKWVVALCEEILARGLKITWHCNTRVELADDELLALMARAGCKVIAFGFESVDEEVLRKMDKRTKLVKYQEAIDACHRNGIQVYGFFMVGNIGETWQRAEKTLAFAKQEKITWAVFSPATAYPGTALHEQALAQGWLKDERWYWKETGESFISIVVGAGGLDMPDFPIEEQVRFFKKANREFYLRPRWLLRMLPTFLHPAYLRKVLPFVPKFLRFNFSQKLRPVTS